MASLNGISNVIFLNAFLQIALFNSRLVCVLLGGKGGRVLYTLSMAGSAGVKRRLTLFPHCRSIFTVGVVPGTDPWVPGSGHLERSLNGDPEVRVLPVVRRKMIPDKPRFYHLRSRDGTPLVEEPSRGIKGNYPFGDDWDKRYLFVKIPGPSPYPSFWRTVDLSRPVSFIGEVVAKLVLEVPQRFRWVNFLMRKEALHHSRNVVRLPVSVIYDGYQKAKTRKRRPSYTPPLRLVRAASSVSGPPSVSLTGAEASFNRISPMAIHQRLLTELFFLRNQVRGMAFHRDQSVLQARAMARWELMKKWLEKRVEHWNPEEEYRRYLFWAEGVDQLMGGEPIQAATPGSAAGSRYSGDPSF
ncbi:hypothetical protein F2Q70_00011960 [Brassica cretica]|uniref:Uncharacterized protein n=1 Tax=Brassica cretica TaxID=69181 RepID=A0A8S9MBN9_BRACR|nr:hypothetical protein F2Q70_00011960 [Brassica cretica]